jgi:RNA polymerase sigma-70 factor (ECF subfamily)
MERVYQPTMPAGALMFERVVERPEPSRGRRKAKVPPAAAPRPDALEGRQGVAAPQEIPVPVTRAREKTNEPHVKDVDLLKAFLAGDERAFAALYGRRKAEVYTYCLRMMGGDPDLASDAFQETFIKVYEKAETFRVGTNVMGWLYMIARNTCLNVHRARKNNDSIDHHPSLESRDRSLRPEYEEEQHFLRAILEEAIQSLPQEFREPFILREFDGFSYGEIASITGATLAMTKIRIHRAKERMRVILKPYLNDDEGRATSSETD